MSIRNLQAQKGKSSGEYVPTITDTTNVAASTLRKAFFVVNGDMVTVFAGVQIDPTAAVPTATTFNIELPFGSSVSTAFDIVGTVTSADDSAVADLVLSSDATTNTIQVDYSAVTDTNVDFSITCAYKLVQ